MRVPAAPSMLEGGWVMLVADGRTGREVCAGVQAAGAVTVLMWLWRIFDACYGEQVFRETRNPRCMALQHPLDTRFNTTEAGLAGCAAGNDRTRWKGRNLRRWIMLNCITLFFFQRVLFAVTGDGDRFRRAAGERATRRSTRSFAVQLQATRVLH